MGFIITFSYMYISVLSLYSILLHPLVPSHLPHLGFPCTVMVYICIYNLFLFLFYVYECLACCWELNLGPLQSRAESILNHWTISPAYDFLFLLSTHRQWGLVSVFKEEVTVLGSEMGPEIWPQPTQDKELGKGLVKTDSRWEGTGGAGASWTGAEGEWQAARAGKVGGPLYRSMWIPPWSWGIPHRQRGVGS